MRSIWSRAERQDDEGEGEGAEEGLAVATAGGATPGVSPRRHLGEPGRGAGPLGGARRGGGHGRGLARGGDRCAAGVKIELPVFSLRSFFREGERRRNREIEKREREEKKKGEKKNKIKGKFVPFFSMPSSFLFVSITTKIYFKKQRKEMTKRRKRKGRGISARSDLVLLLLLLRCGLALTRPRRGSRHLLPLARGLPTSPLLLRRGSLLLRSCSRHRRRRCRCYGWRSIRRHRFRELLPPPPPLPPPPQPR